MKFQRLPLRAGLERANWTMRGCAIRPWHAVTDQNHLDKQAKMVEVGFDLKWGHAMQSISAKDAKYGFGRLIDLAGAEPVLVAKHGRPVVCKD